jgi:histone H2B
MPPKAADKKPASKAPATASKAPEKKDAGKKTAPSGEKKKRTKARKETYSSYIYKGEFLEHKRVAGFHLGFRRTPQLFVIGR